MFKLLVEGILDYMDRRNSKKDSKIEVANQRPALALVESSSVEHTEVSTPDGCPACRKMADKWESE